MPRRVGGGLSPRGFALQGFLSGNMSPYSGKAQAGGLSGAAAVSEPTDARIKPISIGPNPNDKGNNPPNVVSGGMDMFGNPYEPTLVNADPNKVLYNGNWITKEQYAMIQAFNKFAM